MDTQDQKDLKPVDPRLPIILNQMIIDVANPVNHYFVSASYFDFVAEGQEHRRRYLNPIYLHQDFTWNLELAEEQLVLDVMLAPGLNISEERIRIPLNQIYSVHKNHSRGMFESDDLIFHESGKLKMPPLN